MFRQADPNASLASWAIRFAAYLDGIITVLSGMSSLEQMEDNLSFMKEFTALPEFEKATLAQARKVLNSIPLIPCTTCDYCAKVCPGNIDISGSFTAMNYLTLYDVREAAMGRENWLVGGHGKKSAGECLQCGECEKVCPQHIAIMDELVSVHTAFHSS